VRVTYPVKAISILNRKSIEILLIQDDPDEVRLTMETVDQTGLPINLRVLRNDLELAGLRGRERPDLILLELNLQMRSAEDILTRIKQDNELKDIPLAIIGPPSEEAIDACFEDAADVYIAKPLDPQRLIMTVNWAQGL
jgi:two-component system, chemotaxis family, response regulator Rcp1